MTALSAGLALVPLLLGADEPGREILHPAAVTSFRVSTTALDTLMTPILFLSVGRTLERLREDQKELLSCGSVLSNHTGDYA
jgi:Cu/Ag efflux pump CusA